ncbi:MAG: hypothetical protein WDA12_02915 [Bacilli bacterium]
MIEKNDPFGLEENNGIFIKEEMVARYYRTAADNKMQLNNQKNKLNNLCV